MRSWHTVVGIVDDVRSRRFTAAGESPMLEEAVQVDISKQRTGNTALRRAVFAVFAATSDGEAATSLRTGRVSLVTRITFPACRAQLPRRIGRVLLSIPSLSVRASPFCRRVGTHISTFEACSGFTRVTARWIVQPPKAAFVTRLRSSRLPD